MATGVIPIKSPSDHKIYKAFKLPNGVQVCLIHDPEMGTGEELSKSNPRKRPLNPGEDEVVTDEDAESLMSDGESGHDSDGSSGSEEDDGTEDGMSTDEDKDEEDNQHVRPHHPRAQHHAAGPVKKAAASVSVGIGHFSDPIHLQGLSHYLEHMLFMGSDKFPDENDYDAFLSAHGGASNAYTEEEATTFYFDCRPSALRGALERFSRFFVHPLVKADAMEREVQAVDNEFSGVLQSDSCRMLQLRCHTSRPGHVFTKFGWGNRKSLVSDPEKANINVREELLSYYSQQYAAERMNLVVLGGESLETLEAWVLELFQDVPGGKGPRPRFEKEGFPYEGGHLHIIPGVTEGHRITATFQLPCLESQYRKKADEYLSHLIGHEGSGSLLSALKLKGWASELCAGVSDQTSVTYLFEVTITLTQAGLTAGSGCGLAAIELLFEYLAMLKQEGPQRWAFDELDAIAQLKFRFQEEEDAAEYVSQIASGMHSYPPEHVLLGPFIYDEYDPELIKALMNSMTALSVRLDLQTSSFDDCCQALKSSLDVSITKDTEPWFDIKYAQAQLPASLLSSWEIVKPSADIHLPPKNNYLPTNFTLCCDPDPPNTNDNKKATARQIAAENGTTTTTTTASDPVEAAAFPNPPQKLLELPGIRVWHKMDTSFRLPRTNAYFRLASHTAYSSPAAAAQTYLVIKLLEDALCETSYLADVASLHYTIYFAGVEGVDIKVDGFNEKLSLLVEEIFSALVGLEVKDDVFNRVKEALVRQYRNANMKPLKHATYLRLRTLKERLWDVDAILAGLEEATPKSVRSFLPQLLSTVHLEVYVHGNITASDATAVAENARQLLQPSNLTIADRPLDRCLKLQAGITLLYRASVKNPEEDNSVAEIYFQCSTDSPLERALTDMVDQLVHEPCYDTLRTKEQLGYTVHSGPRMTYGVAGFCVLVQSGVHGPQHLESRIDAFLSTYAVRLAEMPDSEFEQQRSALLATKLMKDRNMLEESDRNWDAITLRGCDFAQRRDEVSCLRQLTKDQVLEFFNKCLVPGSKERKKLSVHVVGKEHKEEVQAKVSDDVLLITKLEDLKIKLGHYAAVA